MKEIIAIVLLGSIGLPLPGDPAPAARHSEPAASEHWAFKAPQLPALPKVNNKRWVRHPIDAFVLARLEHEHVAPSPEADRPTLLRRLCLDLLGLPPTPEQLEFFRHDRRPDAYERLVDTLLASPHFGERWGRHWLDLARYADSDGYQIDRPRPGAYVYRNWVIDAINRDLPFDQFTIEQLAGDLLPNATVEQRTAAGFHRNTLWNNEDGVDPEEFRCKAKVDRVSTTGTVWLGLTVGCAQCHSHKYDPITQREFFQLYAFFDRAREVDIPAPQVRELAKYNAEKSAWEQEQTRLSQTADEYAKKQDARLEQIKQQTAERLKRMPSSTPPNAPTFQETTNETKTFVHIRGDFLRKGEEAQPGALSALHRFQPRSARPDRLDLARWLVEPANPLTSRVAVNHVWQHLFGRGLVNTPDDFGARGDPPSHPQLLDWLAVTFRSSGDLPCSPIHSQSGCGWSRKALIRLIVTSAAYRQASRGRPELSERDPENIWLARQNRFRLEAEIVRDVHLAASGLLNPEIGGASFRPHLPDDLKALGSAGAFTWVDDAGPVTHRRGMYIFAQRTVPYPTPATFDQADPSDCCPRRERSNTPLPALTLLNNSVFVECAHGLARRVQAEKGASARDQIALGFELCLGRQPGREELGRLQKLYEDELCLFRKDPPAAGSLAGKAGPEGDEQVKAAALALVAQTLMNLEEFLTRE